MREHLYKGFHPKKNGTTEITLNGEKIKGEWVEGEVVADYCTGQKFIHAYGNSVNESDKINEEGCLKFFAFEIIPETVCEYSNLTDKNGNKIFERHIVKAKSLISEKEAIYLVRFDDTSLWFGFKSRYSGYIFSLDELLKDELGDEIEFEIVGNIFEIPNCSNDLLR